MSERGYMTNAKLEIYHLTMNSIRRGWITFCGLAVYFNREEKPENKRCCMNCLRVANVFKPKDRNESSDN